MMRTFLRIILGLLTFASVSLAYASFTGNTLLTDKEKYLKNILSAEFDEAALNDVKESMLSEGDQFALDYDKIWESVDKDYLLDIMRSYATGFIDSIINGSKFSYDNSYESEELKNEIRRQITVMGDEAGLTDEEIEEDTNSIYTYLKDDIRYSLKFIPEMVTKRLSTISGALEKVRPYTAYGKWFLLSGCVSTLLLAVVSMYKKGFCSGAFFVAVPFWFASAMFFVPSLMLSVYDTSSKIAISESSLYFVFAGILDTVEKQLFNTSALLFAVTTVITFLTAYLLIYKSSQADAANEE